MRVEAVVAEHLKGEKLRVFKYRPKKRYRRRSGHRSLLTRIEISDIKGPSTRAKPEEPRARAKAEEKEPKPRAKAEQPKTRAGAKSAPAKKEAAGAEAKKTRKPAPRKPDSEKGSR
jgi:hypothetical protein